MVELVLQSGEGFKVKADKGGPQLYKFRVSLHLHVCQHPGDGIDQPEADILCLLKGELLLLKFSGEPGNDTGQLVGFHQVDCLQDLLLQCNWVPVSVPLSHFALLIEADAGFAPDEPVFRRGFCLTEGSVCQLDLLKGMADTGGQGELKALLKGAEQSVEHGKQLLLYQLMGVGIEQKSRHTVAGELNSIDMPQGLQIFLCAVENTVFEHGLHLGTVFRAKKGIVVQQHVEHGKDRLVQKNARLFHLTEKVWSGNAVM